MSNLHSVDNYLVQNGPSSGQRLVLIRSGELAIEVLPDRGLDVGRAWWRGKQFALSLPGGIGMPNSKSPQNDWISNFGGGLLVTCGPENFGSSSHDENVSYPTHGSFTNLQFTLVGQETTAEAATVTGVGVYAPLFGESWRISRSISLYDQSRITVSDTLTNVGVREQPVMMLYHVNLGGHFLDEDVTITSPSNPTRLSAKAAFSDEWASFGSGHSEIVESVYLHQSDRPIWATASNVSLDIAVKVSSSSLTNLFQWKYRRSDRWALGLEPASSNSLKGRSESKTNAAKVSPGETWQHQLTIQLSTS